MRAGFPKTKVSIFLLVGLLFISCKEEVEKEAYVQLRMPKDENIALVVRNKITGKERRIDLDNSKANVLSYRMEQDEDESIPTLEQVISQMVGGKNKASQVVTKSEASEPGVFKVLIQDKSQRYESRLKYAWQKPDHPELKLLIQRENLQSLVAGKSELELFFTLQNWVRKQWVPGTPNPYPMWNANQILSQIRGGKTGGFCGQYSQVLAQSLIALGYQARYLWLKNHFALEVFSNTLDKWIVLDPLYNCVYKKQDDYLNAYEVYFAVKSKEANKEVLCLNTLSNDEILGAEKEKILKHYHEVVIDLKNNHLEERMQGVSYVKDYWSHAAVLADENIDKYDFLGGYPLMVPSLKDLYAGENQSAFYLLGMGTETLSMELRTNTPYHKYFEISQDEGKVFQRIDQQKIRLKLKSGGQKLRLRSVNSQGVRGPEARFEYSF